MTSLRHPREPALTPDELAIARSVIYASLFEYPLSAGQLHQTLVESSQGLPALLATFATSPALQAIVEYEDGFFFPAGCAHWVAQRRAREARSRLFLADHRRLLAAIAAMPYTRLVALSGSVAHLNLDPGGDLDLFVVAEAGHVWSVTVAIVLLAKLFRRRRTVCVNFVMADSRLRLDQQELFTANQVVHLKPIIGEPVLRALVDANPFVGRFYPNARGIDTSFLLPRRPLVGRLKQAVEGLLSLPAKVGESLCRRAYTAYLRRHAASWQSPEQVRLEPDYLKLHSHSHRQSIVSRFEGALAEALRRAAASAHRADERLEQRERRAI